MRSLLVAGEVPDGRPKPLRLVAEHAESPIALSAEDAPHDARLVVVVDVEQPAAPEPTLAPADFAMGGHLGEIFGSHPVGAAQVVGSPERLGSRLDLRPLPPLDGPLGPAGLAFGHAPFLAAAGGEVVKRPLVAAPVAVLDAGRKWGGVARSLEGARPVRRSLAGGSSCRKGRFHGRYYT